MTEPDVAVVDAARLRAFLAPHVGGIDDDLSISLVSGGRSNPTFRVTDGHRRWILRRQPFGEVLATAHDMGREHRVITALRGSAVPVPETVVLCQDASVIGSPFYVMADLDGITLRNHSDAAALTDDERARIGEQMATILASLHEIDPESVGLGDFGRPDGFLERQVRRWRIQWDGAHILERPQLDLLLDRLGRSVPTTLYPGVLHGDFKLDNVMLDRADPGRIIGILDWEMSTLGDTMADVGMMMSLWDEPGRPFNPVSAGATANPGFPSRAEVVDRYAHIRGIELPHTDWYVVLAYVKVAVVVEQIHTRHVKGLTLGGGFDDAGAMVDPLLDSAMEIAASTLVPGLRL
ncbi:MAG: phosphotransferase [Actinobacteria bacterium]|uniref:Unannotated protein n=1 Tax=freshwater metagenome TaxID=449393 RepID=A0A6J7NWF9_9ZZZZ|nr:phosphotransferase [Actinomycetota bacterium]